MHKTIVSDTSCFIVLDNIGELDLLKHLYGNIITTPDVANEYGKILPDWVEIKSPFDDQFQKKIITYIKPYLQKLKSTDFRLTPDLEILALKESGEE